MDDKRSIHDIKILIGMQAGQEKDDIISMLSDTYTVEEVSDSVEAYQRIHSLDPDVAILDYSLSKINPINLSDGISFIHSNVYIVICVTSENLEVAKRAWNKRALDFILKPFTAEQFVHEVQKIVRYVIQRNEMNALRKEVHALQDEIKKIREHMK